MFCSHPQPKLCEELGRHLWGGQLKVFLSNAEYAAQLRAEAPFMKGQIPTNKARPGFRKTPCKFELPVIKWHSNGQADAKHERGCEKFERCTRGYVSDEINACSLCSEYVPGVEKFHWISYVKLARDTLALAGRLPVQLAGVAGIPRSGMIPASMLATLLHLPLFEVHETIGTRVLQNGGRGFISRPSSAPLLVIDDTCYMGNAMMRVKKRLAGTNYLTAVVYAHRGYEHVVDFYQELVPTLHVLEWNVFNNGCLVGMAQFPIAAGGVATDLDGILCHDASSGGPEGSPYLVARKFPIPLIVTGRPQTHRAQTEAWLHSQEIKFTRLDMFPGTVMPDSDSIARFKAQVYAKSKCCVFIESDLQQAETIHTLTQKPTVCPKFDRVFQLQ